MRTPPGDIGLYEARREHDSCGIGAVVDISGNRSRTIVDMAREVILNLHHRGAAGADEITGDGAGILFQVCEDFFRPLCDELNVPLTRPGHYGVGMVFLPRDVNLRSRCEDTLARACEYYGLRVLGWRDVPRDPSCLGELSLQAEPVIRQVFVDGGELDDAGLDLQLYRARNRAAKLVQRTCGPEADDFYVCSLSSRTVRLQGHALGPSSSSTYYEDLRRRGRIVSAMCVVHQRFSHEHRSRTGRLAQPVPYDVAHNGEINTLQRQHQHRMTRPRSR